jgi:dimethylamine corrinoid protein
VIEALDRNGLRPRIKAIIGGAAVTSKWAAEIGADGYSRNAIDALELAKNLVSKGRLRHETQNSTAQH